MVSFYIGTGGIEKSLLESTGVPFFTITTGKLRRYFFLKKFFDIFRCVIGLLQSFFYLVWIRPHVIFSKGGYVSVPVSLAAWVLRIPIVTHESDVTPGLANKIIMKLASQVMYSFPQSQKHLPREALRVNLPVRKEIFAGTKKAP